jgi:hypothetical protein
LSNIESGRDAPSWQTVFQKTWRVHNSGTVPWIGRRLTREGAAAGIGIPSSPAFSPIPDTSPGQVVDITVPLMASRIDCPAQIRWKMVDPDGRQYFPDRYWYGLMLIIMSARARRRLTSDLSWSRCPNQPQVIGGRPHELDHVAWVSRLSCVVLIVSRSDSSRSRRKITSWFQASHA